MLSPEGERAFGPRKERKMRGILWEREGESGLNVAVREERYLTIMIRGGSGRFEGEGRWRREVELAVLLSED